MNRPNVHQMTRHYKLDDLNKCLEAMSKESVDDDLDLPPPPPGPSISRNPLQKDHSTFTSESPNISLSIDEDDWEDSLNLSSSIQKSSTPIAPKQDPLLEVFPMSTYSSIIRALSLFGIREGTHYTVSCEKLTFSLYPQPAVNHQETPTVNQGAIYYPTLREVLERGVIVMKRSSRKKVSLHSWTKGLNMKKIDEVGYADNMDDPEDVAKTIIRLSRLEKILDWKGATFLSTETL
ncbi:P protein [Mundri virus]|uniref:P protein n=1 Tax=Mundri virus TaxID=2913478 RepID=UPI002481F3CE|nr:P protein [Mundri virus]UJY53550.1 P protein [Mundri virus]